MAFRTRKASALSVMLCYVVTCLSPGTSSHQDPDKLGLVIQQQEQCMLYLQGRLPLNDMASSLPAMTCGWTVVPQWSYLLQCHHHQHWMDFESDFVFYYMCINLASLRFQQHHYLNCICGLWLWHCPTHQHDCNREPCVPLELLHDTN
jgi:hypothetical protein